MCDMQKMPQSRDDDICEEESDMNFATFQAVGTSGTHFVATTGGQIPVTKLQQNVGNNGASLQQVVGMVGGEMQYLTHATPQLISVPIALPGAKPGDPQPTVQIQVLNPNMLAQQQQPKYQMQIPIQGFPQGGAVLTVAYSPEANEAGGIQLLGNTLPEGTIRMRTSDFGLQVVAALPQEMQFLKPEIKEEQPIHQVYITPNQQIVINGPGTGGSGVTESDDGVTNIVIKEEFDDTMNDEESSADKDTSWATTGVNADLIKYLHTLPPQQAQALPVSLQQFLRLNPPAAPDSENSAMDADNTESEMPDDPLLVVTNKKKKKYKKKPPKPARPKPGQVVIATAADGTTIYCCPECQMAYPEKEQLEMHLIVHKIERRFICGICGAGLKRKEHLERHKLGHNPERPYVCDVCMKGFKRREHLNLHAVIHSGVKTEMCGECGKGFYRKDHLRKHTRSHETKRARDEAAAGEDRGVAMAPLTRGGGPPAVPNPGGNTILPEITIHVPTSGNMQMPVQINIPQHVVSSLQAAANGDATSQLDALLAQHT